MRLIIFSPACLPAAQPEAIVNANLAQAFVEAGWEIDVISIPEHGTWYPSSDEAWASVAPFVHPAPKETKGRIGTHVSMLKFALHSRLAVRERGWAIPAYEIAMRLVRRNRYDFVLSRSLPGSAHLPALLLAKRTGIPWVANWNDPYPPDKHPPPYGKGPDSPLTRGLRKTLPAVARTATWHTFPCERLRALMCSYLEGNVESKSSVIPHIALSRASPTQRQSDVFTLCHAGSLRPPRDARVFLEGVKRFASSHEVAGKLRIRFIVESAETVLGAARSAGVEDLVAIEEPRPYAKMGEALDNCDVLVIIEAPMSEGIFLPSKFVDYAQAGRPILAVSPTVGTLADILSEHGGGIAVDGQSPSAVADAISVLYDSWRSGTLQQRYGSGKLADVFYRDRILQLYTDLFSRLRSAQPNRRE